MNPSKDYRPAAFILGAGASMPYGFPSGEQLVQHIIRDMRTGANQAEVEKLFSPEYPEARRKEFGEALLRSSRSSIDTFLETNTQFAEIGKLAIAYQLIKCEQPQNIFEPPTNAIGRPIGGNWHKYLFNNFLLNGPPETLTEKKLLVLTFNYDRSFEFALFNAIKYSYSLSDKDAQDLLVRGVRILHLHGDLGALFEMEGTPGEHRNFTPVLTPESVRIAQRRLRVVHDAGRDALALYDAANEALKEYRIACFLGFSYNEISLQRLRSGLVEPRHTDKPTILWGTTLGLVQNDFLRIEQGLGRGLSWQRSEDCLEFLQEAKWFDPAHG